MVRHARNMDTRPSEHPAQSYDELACYYDEVSAFVMSRLRRPDEVAEVVQEAFTRVLAKVGERPIERPRDYLFRAALNLLTDRSRRRSVASPVNTTHDEQWIDPRPCPRRVAELRDEIARIQAAIGSLPPRTQQVFAMHRQRGMSYAQIAGELRISESAVEKHIMRALETCRRCVA